MTRTKPTHLCLILGSRQVFNLLRPILPGPVTVHPRERRSRTKNKSLSWKRRGRQNTKYHCTRRSSPATTVILSRHAIQCHVFYNVLDAIHSVSKGKARYFRGQISKVNADDTYNIVYVDGDTEKKVKREYIRVVGVPSS